MARPVFGVDRDPVASRSWVTPGPAERDATFKRDLRAFAKAEARNDAPSVWSDAILPGGYVCGTCEAPVESEPCREHQPIAWAREYGGFDG
jgi:hypothetical protein